MLGDVTAISAHGDEVFENYPAPTLVVDEDVRVLRANRAARDLLGEGGATEPTLIRRGGELIRCIHSFGPGGCGRQPNCDDCVVRNAVRGAIGPVAQLPDQRAELFVGPRQISRFGAVMGWRP